MGQQRIVSLGLELRAIEASLPLEDKEIRARIGQMIDGLSNLHSDLEELSRDLNPAILSRDGLGAAITTLARRCPIPVDLTIDIETRLPESVEVAGYYLVAESLTNTAKYAQASAVAVTATATDGILTITISPTTASAAPCPRAPVPD